MNQTIAGIGKTENLLTKLIERDIQLLRSTAVQLILKQKRSLSLGLAHRLRLPILYSSAWLDSVSAFTGSF
jgi:hypothetical protein